MDFSHESNCLNCGSELTSPFCGNCGQKKAERITFSRLLKVIQRGIFEFKSPLLTTIVGLTINPSRVYREYIDGKRISYFNPFKYSFWMVTLLLLISTFFNTPVFDFSSVDPNMMEEQPFLLDVQIFLNGAVLYAYFLNSLFAAFVFKMFFRKERYSFSELCVPATLSLCHFCLFYVLLILIGIYDHPFVQMYISIIAIAYQTWAISGIYVPKKKLNYFKSFLASAISYLVFSILFVAVITASYGISEGYNEAHQKALEREKIVTEVEEQ